MGLHRFAPEARRDIHCVLGRPLLASFTHFLPKSSIGRQIARSPQSLTRDIVDFFVRIGSLNKDLYSGLHAPMADLNFW